MSSLLERGVRGETLDDIDIVDMHCHLGRYEFAVPETSPASLVRVMDRIGVSCAVASHTRVLSGRVRAGNDEVIEAARAFPGRIFGYAILWPTSAAWVREETLRCLDAGFVGVKLHNANGFPYTHPAYAPAFEIADDRKLPVLLHTYGEAPELAQARELAGRYPNVRLLLAHAGAKDADGYVSIANDCANVYLDLCMSRQWRGLIERFCAEVGADRIVWGSDATFLNMAHQIGKVLGAHIPDEDKTKLLSTNARRILSGAGT